VSLIHKALRQAERASNQGPKNEYNPLSPPQQVPQAATSPLVIIGGLLIWAAIAVVAWPVAEPDALTSETETLTWEALISETLISETLSPESLPDIESEQNLNRTQATETGATDAALSKPHQNELSQVTLATTALPGLAESSASPASEDAATWLASASAPKEPLRSDQAITAAGLKPTSASIPSVVSNRIQATPHAVKNLATTQLSAAKPPLQIISAAATGPNRSIKPARSAEVKLAGPIPDDQSIDSVIVQSKSLWHQQVQQAMAEGAIEQAEAILKQWLGAAPSDPLPRIWLARIYIKNGFYLAAEPLLTNLSGSDAKALLGLIYERSDRPTLAAKLFEALYQVNPENGRWLLFWAVNSENSGQLAKSRSLYQTYLTLFELEDPALTQFSQQRLTTLGGY
jgi:hypothetical protein